MWAGGRSTGAYQFSIAGNGSLHLRSGQCLASRREPLELVITDRKGAIERLKIPPDRYTSPPRISPDGKRVVFGINDGKESIIYTYDLSGEGSMERVTFGSNNRLPVWSSDGTRIAFQSDREGDLGIWQSTIGGPAERVTKAGPGESHEPEDWHPKTDVLLFNVTKRVRRDALDRLDSGQEGNAVQGHAVELPDRRAIPPERALGGLQHQQRNGGIKPLRRRVPIRRRPRALVAGANPTTQSRVVSRRARSSFTYPRIFEFEAVSVTTDPTFSFGKAVTVPRPFQPGAPNSETLYDVLPTRPAGSSVSSHRAGPIPSHASNREMTVVLNWFEELKARVPSR